jgi:hypothetical protein
VALLVLVVVGMGLTTARPAAAAALPAREITPPIEASNGYRETATTTYSVNPARARVDVTIQVEFKNTKPPTPTTTYFYNQVYVFTEHAATHVAVHVDHNPAAVILMDRRQGAFDRRLVRWGTALLFGQTRHIIVTYRLPSGAPRSTSEIRVGEAIASFCVIGQGDDGGATRVVIPAAFDVTVSSGAGGVLREPTGTGTSGHGTVTWSTGRLDRPFEFWACLSGTNVDGYATHVFQSPSGRSIRIEAWPEDKAWDREVQGEIDDILTDLETLVGRGIPGSIQVVVREVGGGELGLYAGFYDPDTGVARIGEDLGQGGTLAHELSHTWFNDRAFFDRWVSEGLAEWARVSIVPDTCPAPSSYPGAGGPNLDVWQFVGPRDGETQFEIVQYEYNAACYLWLDVAEKMGQDRMRTVLGALFDSGAAYRSGDSVPTRPKSAATWRQVLDAIDELGLVPAGFDDLDYAQDLFLTYGIGREDRAALAERSDARAAYHALAAELGDWVIPPAILEPMAQWRFQVAQDALATAAAIRASVAHANATLPGLDAANGPVRALFEGATSVADLEAAATKAADQASAADTVVAARARIDAPRDALAQLGLLWGDPSGPLAAATAAAANADLAGTQASVATIDGLIDGASQQGLIRAGIGAWAVLLLLLFLFLLARRRSSRRAAALAAAAAPPAAEAPPAAAAPPAMPPTVPGDVDAGDAEPPPSG